MSNVFTLWMTMHGRLQTLDKLHSLGMGVDAKFPMSQTQDETRNHLHYSTLVSQSILR